MATKADFEADTSTALYTNPLYFSDTYLFSCTAKLLKEYDSQRQGKTVKVLILDQTIMHPQGGGQPADVGCITRSDDSSVKFEVQHVQKSPGSECIEHIGEYKADTNTSFIAGDQVCVQIDETKRRLNARVHSAGHLLDSAIDRLGLTNLEPSKGYHFPDGPYVEYIGDIPADERHAVIESLNTTSKELIKEAIPTVVKVNDGGEREVTVGGTSCLCGGTHVNNTSEIVGMKITKIKKVKKNVKVSYCILDNE